MRRVASMCVAHDNHPRKRVNGRRPYLPIDLRPPVLIQEWAEKVNPFSGVGDGPRSGSAIGWVVRLYRDRRVVSTSPSPESFRRR